MFVSSAEEKMGKGNYTHVETEYVECVQLFAVRKGKMVILNKSGREKG